MPQHRLTQRGGSAPSPQRAPPLPNVGAQGAEVRRSRFGDIQRSRIANALNSNPVLRGIGALANSLTDPSNLSPGGAAQAVGRFIVTKRISPLVRRPVQPGDADTFINFLLRDPERAPGVIAKGQGMFSEGGKKLFIAGIDPGTPGDVRNAQNVFGTRSIREMLRSLREQFPELKEITGMRITGARAESGKLVREGADVTSFKLKKGGG